MKTVAFDAHMVGTQETGNETYAVRLAEALAHLGGYTYRLYTPKPEALDPNLRRLPGVEVQSFADVPSIVRIPLLYPRMAAAGDVSLLHMQYVAPPRSPCPVVLSVHDVSYRIYPEFFSPRVRLITGLLVGPSMRRAAKVITISESSKRDILRFYRLPPEKVVVTPLAAGAQFVPQPAPEVERVRKAYGLPSRYILAVGNVQPRKNLPRLIEAFGAATKDDPAISLVIAGRSGWRGSEVENAVNRLGLGSRVRFPGYVSDADLPAMYSGAVAFCYPSLYEGFGLPPLEAMACGTPCVVSNAASLPAVVADAALPVEPTSTRQIAEALSTLLASEPARQEYSARGKARAALFSWRRSAQLTRDVYDDVLGVHR